MSIPYLYRSIIRLCRFFYFHVLGRPFSRRRDAGSAPDVAHKSRVLRAPLVSLPLGSALAPPRRDFLGRDDEVGRAEGSDRSDRPPFDGDERSREADASTSSTDSGLPQTSARTGSASGGGFVESLRDVLRGESDGSRAQDGEDGVIQWLRALDLQVLGACRADERLKPLLKINASNGAADDRLLTHLSQHFEASEVGMLARYLCVPLVSIRVGKVTKEGNLLCPTSVRGHLNLNLLPSSNMRLSFIGDDGFMERLAVVSNDLDSCEVIIEEITADTSGRSFLVKLLGSRVFYYWCSEKSKLHGMELLAKMKDLVKTRPSLSSLTGIYASRLDSFATHVRAYLLGLSRTAEASSVASSDGLLGCSSTHRVDSQASCMASKSSRLRLGAPYSGKVHSSCQGSLSPRSNTFKDGTPRSFSSIRNGMKEKLKRRGENHLSSLSINSETAASVSAGCTAPLCTSQCVDNKLRDTKNSDFLSCYLPVNPSLSFPLLPFNPISVHLPPFQIAASSSLFSPYYCWCPPCPSPLQCAVGPPCLPPSSSESLPLPSLSTLLSATGPTSLMPYNLPIDAGLPDMIPDPLFPVALPVSSLTLPGSQHIPTFIPFMSDPIVHIPIINVCSSGQGFLVSAGPVISSSISPLLPTFVNPLIPKAEYAAEKSARETLQMLMASSPIPFNPQMADVLPVVLNNVDDNCSWNNVREHAVVSLGSGALFGGGTLNMNAVTSDFSCLGLHPLDERIVDEGRNAKRSKPGCISEYDEHTKS